MSQPTKLDEMLRIWWASESYKRGSRALQSTPRARRLPGMTTNRTPDEEYMIIQRVALLIEDEADNGAENPKQAAADYIENVIDNGWISDSDDTPVWELIEKLGYDRNTMDPFVVFAEIASLINETDLFND